MNKSKTQSTIRERLKGGYTDACKLLNWKPLTLELFKQLYQDDDQAQAFFSLHKITTVIKALKEGKKLDYNKSSQLKHYPWFDMETYGKAPAGSGFRLYDVCYELTCTGVGARLSSLSEEDARFVAELLKDDYKNWMKEEIIK